MCCTFEEHLANLEEVLSRLRRARLKLKPTKCHLMKGEVNYLGYLVSPDRVAPDPAKIKAVKEYPTPRDVRKVRSFIGLASYYRRFVPNFAKIAWPLHKLTKKDAWFSWTEECEQAFNSLKEKLVTAPVLVFPNFSVPFQLETDASGSSLGAILSQKQPDGEISSHRVRGFRSGMGN